MDYKKIGIVLVIIAIISALAFSSNFSGYLTRTQETQKVVSTSNVSAVVSRVIDGDTVELTDGERVRLIGIDTTEKGDKCFQEGKDRMKQLVEGKDVILEPDITDKDRYGRLLRYIFVDDKFVNWVMVREGLAKMYTIRPDVKYINQLEQAFLLARNENGCLWKNS